MKNTNIAAVFFIPICAVATRYGDYYVRETDNLIPHYGLWQIALSGQ